MNRNRLCVLAAAACLPLLSAAAAEQAAPARQPQLSNMIGLTPGSWKSTLVFEELALEPMPGRAPVPEATLEAMRRQIGQSSDSHDCLVANPSAHDSLLLPAVTLPRNCTVAIDEASNGRLRYRATCDNGAGFAGEASGEATYTPTSIEGRHRMRAASPGAGVIVSTVVRLTSRRMSGLCPPARPTR